MEPSLDPRATELPSENSSEPPAEDTSSLEEELGAPDEMVEDAAPPESARELLLVVGSGRSGTSVLAGTLQRLGFHVPQPEVTPDETNPRGFGEPQWVVDFHTDLLASAAVQVTDARPSSWARAAETGYDITQRARLADWLTEQFAISDHVVIKDPRLLWFVPLWRLAARDAGSEARFITMLRHPAEVVASKERWYDNFSNPTNRLAGWVNTMLYTERATRDATRSFVLFDALLADWAPTIARLDAQLGLSIMREVRIRHLQAVDQLIDPGLRRSKATWEAIEAPKQLIELADRVWADTLSLAENTGPPADVHTRLDADRLDYVRMYADAEAISYSSVLAARRAGTRKPPPVPASPPQPVETTSPANKNVVGRGLRSLPTGVKQLVPEAIRGPLRRRLN
jgi:Sulfotransferase family